MGSACKLRMSREELIEIMQQNIDWSVMTQPEATQLHMKITEAANLVILAAPQALCSRSMD